ncbi:MAG TPA: hypothetical protein DEG17_10580 [Cyanobacteria bacterium UBA11149]|nr:hypothetical protein [Cyanobacteria bacterium UBA11149]
MTDTNAPATETNAQTPAVEAPSTETNPETQPDKEKRFGYNALKIPVFAPPIQAKLGIGEVANSEFQEGNSQTPLASAESQLQQPQEVLLSFLLRPTDKQLSTMLASVMEKLFVDSNTAKAILAAMLEGTGEESWLRQRQISYGADGQEYVTVIVNIELLKEYYSQSAKATPLSSGTEVQTIGIVANQSGVNLREKPATDEKSAIIKNLPFNTRVFVDKALPGDWYRVTLTSGEYGSSGEYGYVAASNIKTNLPEPNARLHKIASGETALVIAQKYYGNAVQPGQDLRFYVNVLVYVNPGGGIYKPNPEASWENTLTKEGYLIWIPSLEFASLLKGQVQSGSITYSAWNQVKEITTLAGNFALGGGAFVAGLLNGALESLWDTLVGFKDLAVLAWEIVESLFKGTILADAKQLWDSLSQLNLEQLIEAGIEHLAEKWNQPDLLKRWHFRGWLCGYAIAELVMLVFSEGILTVIKGAAKAGKLSEILAKFPKVAELGQKAKTLGGDKVERLRIALKTSQPLLVARQWAANVLRIPAEILQDLSVEAIERLKQLPRWARDRFSELNHGAMRRVLGCASPCLVNLQEVERYLKNLAADAVAGAKRLTTAEEVINALPTELLNLTKLREKLAKPELMNIIRRAELTDLDFAKMRDFITKNIVGNKTDSYNVFTQYLSAVVPSKLGPDLNKFIEFAEPMDDSTGRALRGAMFENFAKLHVPEFQGLERATFKVPGYKNSIVNVDLFDPANGKIWEFKYQKTPLASQELDKYVPIIGQITIDELYEAKTANFVFPTRDLAELNYGKLKARPAHSVFYLEQLPNQATRPVELQ